MGCLKLNTEKEYIALKVVYRKNQASAHGITSGLINVASSGGFESFGSGFASGAVASLIGSGMEALGSTANVEV